jgi:hypothetical protein
MKELDLHGLSHLEVEDKVENFILSNDAPFRIITGYSEKMRGLVKQILNKHKLMHYVPAHNAGEIIVID